MQTMQPTYSEERPRDLLATFVIVIAAPVAVVAWGIFVFQLINRPAPHRTLDVSVGGRTLDDRWQQFCGFSGVVYEADTVWRNCEMRSLDVGLIGYNVARYDLPSGEVIANWHQQDDLNMAPNLRRFVAFMPVPKDGGMVVALRDISAPTQLYWLRRDDTVEQLPALAEDEQLLGMAYVRNHVHLVLQVDDVLIDRSLRLQARLNDYNIVDETLESGLSCDGAVACRHEFVYYDEDDSWQIVSLRAMSERDGVMPTDVLVGASGEAPEAVSQIDLQIGDHYTTWISDDGSPELTTLPILDNTIAFRTPLTVEFLPFVAPDGPRGGWQALSLPPIVEEVGIGMLGYKVNYALHEGRLSLRPGMELNDDSYLHQVDDDWIQVSVADGNFRLSALDASAVGAQSPKDGLFTLGNIVLPRSGGGYWFIVDGHHYMAMDANLRRVDAPNPLERFWRLLGGYAVTDDIRSEFDDAYASVPLTVAFMLLLPPAVGGAAWLLTRFGQPQQVKRVLFWSAVVYLAGAVYIGALFLQAVTWV